MRPRVQRRAGPSVVLGLALLLALGAGPAAAQDDAAARLGEIQDDMVQLKFERALTGIEALLADARLTPDEITQAYILRSQTHVALGDLDAAEADYREILRRRPAYTPDEQLTPKKARARFDAVRKAMIGRLRIVLEPPDAVLTVDGVPKTLDAEGLLLLPGGEYRVRGDRAGYDPFELTVQVAPDTEQPVELRLVPNSRSVLLSTEPAGVEVLLDGKPVGVTERPEILPGASVQPARLLLENVPLGSHEFELRLPCYRTERRRDILTVDLLDNSTKHYDTVTLQPSKATLVLQGGPEGAEVTIDGKRIGRLPTDPQEVCPGLREIAVTRRGRTIWSLRREFEGSTENRLPVVARPNAVVFAEAWPAELRTVREDYNAELRGVPAGADLSTPDGFRRLNLPADTDLAVAVLPGDRLGAGDRWYVYSPILAAVEQRGRIGDELSRPDWSTRVWGIAAADSTLGGPALVVELTAGSPATPAGLRVGDRVLAVDGRPLAHAADLARALAEAGAAGRTGLELEWSDGSGQPRKATVPGAESPELAGRTESVSRDAARAAWAVVDGLSSDDPAALANLALLFSDYGQPQAAEETWRRVRWNGRRGVGDGTAQYYLGGVLVQRGDEAAAVEAFRRAVASESTAFTDAGPRVGPAAVDCLADLGVATN